MKVKCPKCSLIFDADTNRWQDDEPPMEKNEDDDSSLGLGLGGLAVAESLMSQPDSTPDIMPDPVPDPIPDSSSFESGGGDSGGGGAGSDF